MKALQKLVMFAAVAAVAACPSFALTEKVGDYTWTYTTSSWTNTEGKVFTYATLGDGTNACVSPAPVGRIALPKKLGGHKVTGLANYAFKGCPGLTEVQIAENIEWTDEKAFNGASALQRIVVANWNEYFFSYDGVLYAGEWDGAELVRVPEAYAKADFTGLTKPMAEYVWPDAFRDCVNIKTVTVNGYSMWGLEEATFAGCSSFESFVWESEVEYDGEKEWYKSCVRDGVLYDDEGVLLRWPTAKPFTGVLPTKVGYVADWAFAGNMTVTNVTLKAFGGMCDDIESPEIASLAFKDCVNLKTIAYESWADPELLWALEDPEYETGVHLEKVIYPWQPAIAEEWEGYDYQDYTGGVHHVTGYIADFKAAFPASKIVFEKAKDPNLGVTNMTFPYTTRWINLESYDFEAYADTLTTLTFDGPAAEGLFDILEICTNVTKIIYSANPIYRDYDGEEWIGWKTARTELEQVFPGRVFTFEQGAVPTEPQFYSEWPCEGELSAFYAYDDDDNETVFPCVWPAPKGELVIPNEFYYAEGEAFKGLTGITSLTLPYWFEFSDEALDSLASCSNLAKFNVPVSAYLYDEEGVAYYSNYYGLQTFDDGILYYEGGLLRVPPAYAETNLFVRSWEVYENALVGCRNIQTLTVYNNAVDMLFDLDFSGCDNLTEFALRRMTYEWGYQVIDGALYEVSGDVGDDTPLALVLWPPAKKPIQFAPGLLEVYPEAFCHVLHPENVTELEIPVTRYGENCYIDLWDLASEYGFTGLRKLTFDGYPEVSTNLLEVLPNLSEVVYSANPRWADIVADVKAEFVAAGSSVKFTARTPAEPEYVYEGEAWFDDAGNLAGGCWLGDGDNPWVWPALKGAYDIPEKLDGIYRVNGAYANAFANMAELTELTFPASFYEFEAYSRDLYTGTLVDSNGVTMASVNFYVSEPNSDYQYGGESRYVFGIVELLSGERITGGDYMYLVGTDDGSEVWESVNLPVMLVNNMIVGTLLDEKEIVINQPPVVVEYSPFTGCTNLKKVTFNGACPYGLAETLELTPSIKEVAYSGHPWYQSGWAAFIEDFAVDHPNVKFTKIPLDLDEGEVLWNFSYEDGLSLLCVYDDDGNAVGAGVYPLPSGGVKIPEGVEYVGEDAFLDCSDMTSLVLPSSLMDFAAWISYPGYWDDATGKWVVTNGTPESIGFPFTGCSNLAKLTFSGPCPGGLEEVLELAPSIKEVVYPGTPWLREEWTDFIVDFTSNHVGAVTFTQAAAPDEPQWNIEWDGRYGYLYGEVWEEGSNPVVRVGTSGVWPVPASGELVVPEGVIEISEGAFFGCVGVTKLVLPSTLEYLEEGALADLPNLQQVVVSSTAWTNAYGEIRYTYYRADENGLLYDVSEEADLIFCPPCIQGTVVLGEKCWGIREGAFTGCTNITEIVLSGEKEIDDEVFAPCTALERVTADVTAYGLSHAFGPDQRIALTLRPERWWECECEDEFDDCPCDEDTCDENCGCPGKWYEDGFLEEYFFEDADWIVSLTVEDGVWGIDEGSFYECSNLAEVELPASLDWMGEGTFADCTNLLKVCYYGNAPYGCEGLYEGTSSNLVSYVKYGTTGWNGYEGDDALPSPAVWPVWAWDDEKDVAADEAARAVVLAKVPVDYYVDDTLHQTTEFYVGTAPALPEMAKVGYTFGGWFTDAERTVAADPDDKIGAFGDSRTFYGAFKPNTYTVTFDAMPSEASFGNKTVTFDAALGELPTATRTGYSFDGWFDAAGVAVTAETIVTTASDFVLTAQWTANRYTVEFDANGGTGYMAAQSYIYDVEQYLNECTFTRSAYEFVGWSLTPGSDVIKYFDGENILNMTAAADGKVTLYAVWERSTLWAPVAVDDDSSGGGSSSGAEQGDEKFDGAAAETYDGYVYTDDGVLKGTVQVKAAKAKLDRKTDKTVSKITVAIQLVGEKKVTAKGDLDLATAKFETTAGGRALSLAIGANGVTGMYGAYYIDGAQNKFTSKDAADKQDGAAALARWQGVYTLARKDANGWSGFSLTVAAKGKVKVQGFLADGTKVSVTSQLLVGEDGVCAIPVVIAKKVNVAFNVWLTDDGVEVVGLDGEVVAGRLDVLKGGAYFSLDGTAFSALLGDGTYAGYLPDGLAVSQNGTKLVVADGAKAGKVQLAKDGTVDDAKAGVNPSALKLTYTAKTGILKGTFKAYTHVNGKPKAVTVTVTGILVDGKGYGTVSIKKPALSLSFTIE